ncbi:hypothetical protein [Streptomyces sp. NPDC102462]|uniref:hypothetical protein n=1 Tax=Streptomyces sp. NPDC102462 TaxID=3366178 RepID=UPI00382935BD
MKFVVEALLMVENDACSLASPVAFFGVRRCYVQLGGRCGLVDSEIVGELGPELRDGDVRVAGEHQRNPFGAGLVAQLKCLGSVWLAH